MSQKKKSLFERLTGGVSIDEDFEEDEEIETSSKTIKGKEILNNPKRDPSWVENFENNKEDEEGELSLDIYQTSTDIIVETMVAGVKPENIEINITRDSITVRGKREQSKTINDEDYHLKELYWGSFSRTVDLPAEIEPEDAEAIEKHGLLLIKLPKIDKTKKATLKIKSI